jgi:hypothetical protein
MQLLRLQGRMAGSGHLQKKTEPEISLRHGSKQATKRRRYNIFLERSCCLNNAYPLAAGGVPVDSAATVVDSTSTSHTVTTATSWEY